MLVILILFPNMLNQAKILQTQDEKYKKGFQFDHVWPILKGIEKFANNFSNRANALQEEVQNVISSPSLQEESSSSPCMNSFDLNMNKEDVTSNLSKRSMGRKQQSEEQFKQMMEQNDNLIKAIAKGTSERNEIQRQKVEVQRMKQE
ncbi:hypothetical protein YC2023_051678 [Brassica napus]